MQSVRPIKATLAALALCIAGSAGAQPAKDWPTQPIKIVVPFLAGSATDLISRTLGQALTKEYGQTVVVQNRPGAAAMIGSEAVASAAPDGYTLLMSGPASMVTNRFLYKNLSYDPDGFEKISVIAYTPNILLANPSLPFKTLPEMIAYARANPNKLSYASFGAGTTSHLAGEMLKTMAGIDILHVPYKGAGEAIPAVVSGQVALYFDTIMTGMPMVTSGKLNALGMSSGKRSAIAPEIPTIAEQGYPGYDIAPWYALVAPKGTPKDIVAKLNNSITRLLQDPAFVEKLAATGAEPTTGTLLEFTDLVSAEIPRTEKLVKQSGLTLN